MKASANSIEYAVNFTAVLLALFFLPLEAAFACDACNLQLYREMLSKRQGTLVADELLRAMNNQTGAAFPSQPAFISSLGVGKIPSSPAIASGAQTQPAPGSPPSYAAGPAKEEAKKEFIQVIERDKRLSIPATSYVPQDTKPTTKVSIDLEEGETYLGKGVFFKGFTTNKTIPGPTIVVDEGDIVEFTVNNKGTIPHGASIHSAYPRPPNIWARYRPVRAERWCLK